MNADARQQDGNRGKESVGRRFATALTSIQPTCFLPLALALALSLFCVPWAVLAPVFASVPAAERPRYNVLFIIVDDLAANLTSVYENGPVRTPNMERLAARGTWFTRAYADSPLCNPSRTSFLTGIHTAKSGIYYNPQSYKNATIRVPRVVTLPGYFLNNGYLVAGYGKVAHNPHQEEYADDFTPGYFKRAHRKEDIIHTEVALLRATIPGTRKTIPGNPSTERWTRGILEKNHQ